MSRPPVPPRESPRAAGMAQIKRLSAIVGGRDGRMLMRYAMAVANAQPDLTVRTRTAVSSQAALYLDGLGAYDPDYVSLATMKRMELDPQIQLAMAATRSPITEAPVYFESVSHEAAALCEAAYGDSGILRSLQRSSLDALFFGFSPHEQIWEAAKDFTVSWGEPGPVAGGQTTKEKSYPTLFLPKRRKDLDPARVILMQDEYGAFAGMAYGAVGTAGNLIVTPEALAAYIAQHPENFVPAEKSFLFTNDFRWQNWHGRGRAVSAYDPWFWQRIIYLLTNRWYERKSDPPYLGYAPSDPFLAAPSNADADDYDPDDESQSPVIKLRRLIEGTLRSSGVVVVPSEPYKDDNGKPSAIRAYDLKELGVQDVHPAFLAYIQHLDVKKTRALLVPDGAIAASENSGTYGSTKSLSSLAIKIQNETLNEFVRCFNEYELKRFLRYNGIKDRVLLRTTGVSEDNKTLIADVIDLTFQADMLHDQVWGPVNPDSFTNTIDRRKLARMGNIPLLLPAPGSPPPKVPPPIPRVAPQDKPPAGAGGGGGGAPSGRGTPKKPVSKTGLSTAKRLLDTATSAYADWADAQAADEEQRVTDASTAAPYRAVIDEHEKAVAAILLWFLLRADKTDKGGRKKPGLKKADNYVFDAAGKFRDAGTLAAALPDLDRLAADYDSQGFRVDPTTSKAFLAKAEKGVRATLDGLPDEVAAAQRPETYLAPALEEARQAVRGMVERFDSASAGDFVPLDGAEAGAILALNGRGLLYNVENIGVRSTRSAVEQIINAAGNRRELGAIRDVTTAQFNALYTDLSIEAHFRAVYRAALVALAEKNGYSWLYMAAPSGSASTGSEYAGTVRTIEQWDAIGERVGSPSAVRQFGFHPGSTSYWYPVPNDARRKPGSYDKLVARVLAEGAARRAERRELASV